MMKRAAMMVLVLAVLVWAETAVSPRLLELANTEKEFSATAGEIGVRDAFLKYFAEDSILMQPEPVSAVEELRKQPPAPKPLQFLLQWEPLTGELSADGDFGYLTGPTLTTDRTGQNRPPQHGMYFSVWRRRDNKWRVVLDGGIRTPGPVAELGKIEFRNNAARAAQARTVAMKSGQTLQQAETALAAAVAREGAGAVLRFAAPNMRLYRNGSYPMASAEEISAYLGTTPDIQSPKVQGSGLSQADDLGYTYGTYQGTANFFSRVWKRNAAGEWQVVFDIKYEPRPQPPAQTPQN
jgi:ketosteroid isomerase-like protein